MPSKKPTQPPASDFSTMEKAWFDNLRRPDGQPYEVFDNQTLTKWKRWVGGEFEYDGSGLRDVVNANAILLDQVQDDLGAHKAADLNRHQVINGRLAALEAAVSSPPFPG
jgi:hypothetical protein